MQIRSTGLSRPENRLLQKVVLKDIVAFAEIFDAKLSVGSATIIILDNRITDIDRITGLDMIEIRSHIEGNRRDMVIWM